MADDFSPADDKEFGVEFEFDSEGVEPGLELDRSVLDDEPSEPQPQVVEPEPPETLPEPPEPQAQAAPVSPPPDAVPPERRAAPPPRPQAAPATSPLVILIVGAAALVIVIVGVLTFSDSEPPPTPLSEMALEEGERAYHQGKWVDALKAFERLKRFPTSPEAESVRSRGLEEKAFKQIMEAEPSSTTVKRLEDLSQLYPNRPEVRTRLGEVRKALSSGARVAPPDEPDD